MITQKQLDKWRHAEMVKTTMPLESELLEAAAWEVVGQLLDEVELLQKTVCGVECPHCDKTFSLYPKVKIENPPKAGW